MASRLSSHSEYIQTKYAIQIRDLLIKDGKGHHVSSWIAKRAASPLNLYNDGNLAYYLPITIGTPAQKFNVYLDMASHVIWVGSSTCRACNNRHYFKSDESSTYVNTSEYLYSNFGAGTVAGYQSTVLFCLSMTF